KIVEFILDLNEIKLSTKKDILNKEKKIITEEWRNKINYFSNLEKRVNCTIKNIPEELTTDNSEINDISIYFSTSENEEIDIQEFMVQKTMALEKIENRPLSTIKNNREDVILEYNQQKEEYFKLKDHIRKFENKLRVEKNQYEKLNNQRIVVQSEIKDHINLQKVFSENIINERGT